MGQQDRHLYNHLTTLPWRTPHLPLLILSSLGHSKRQTLGHGASLSQFSKCLEEMFGTAAQQPSALCQLFFLRKTTLVRTPVSARNIAQERNHMTSLFQESKVCSLCGQLHSYCNLNYTCMCLLLVCNSCTTCGGLKYTIVVLVHFLC